ncbi:hypothetical protein RvY_12301 [Ramazzottius varieornatus]|uniref:Uncharacterized protein n=1 Tax=Ramazzottius varieornatus TaxID=947166 RepID=A0A1D1VJ02_RAMVA|nr:hypothetical protein RvY_12301 [Ramazzottius varieornatus]
MFVLLFAVFSFVEGTHGKSFEGELPLTRNARQTFNNNALPGLVQLLSQLPTGNAQDIAACLQLTSDITSLGSGCAWVPNVLNAAGRVIGCRLECNGDVTQFAGVVPSQSFINILTADTPYLLNGQFQISDQSGLDVLSGAESYFLFTSPTATSAAPITSTSTSTAATGTLGSTTTTPTATNPVTPRPSVQESISRYYAQGLRVQGGCYINPNSGGTCCQSPAVTALQPKPDCNFPPEQALLERCIKETLTPDPAKIGCSFDNSGTVNPEGGVNCGVVCPPPPPLPLFG